MTRRRSTPCLSVFRGDLRKGLRVIAVLGCGGRGYSKGFQGLRWLISAATRRCCCQIGLCDEASQAVQAGLRPDQEAGSLP